MPSRWLRSVASFCILGTTMLAIKFRPVGRKKQRTFRVVVAERRSKLKGRSVEELGWFNPHTDEFNVNGERTKYWIAAGAQPTDSVHNLLVRAGVISGPKRSVHSTRKRKKTEEPESTKTDSAPEKSSVPADEVGETPKETAEEVAGENEEVEDSVEKSEENQQEEQQKEEVVEDSSPEELDESESE